MDKYSKDRKVLMRLHSGLPRQGPGSDETTAAALKRLPQIPTDARIYDLGCGPGRASLVLARILRQKIIAVDLQQGFLQQLSTSAAEQGLSDFIATEYGDMVSLPDEAGTINLIWSEGAIYCIGFDVGLKAWCPLLADDGLVACSELSWLTAQPSVAPATFWLKNYPAMRSVTQNIAAAEGLGYKCLAHFTIPTSCWWDEYYDPWLRRLDKLSKETVGDEFVHQAIGNATEEINLFRQFHQEYGYEFYLLQKTNGQAT
jgi:serine/threonine-protein kinase HipA